MHPRPTPSLYASRLLLITCLEVAHLRETRRARERDVFQLVVSASGETRDTSRAIDGESTGENITPKTQGPKFPSSNSGSQNPQPEPPRKRQTPDVGGDKSEVENYLSPMPETHDDVVDGDEHELDKEPNETHDEEAHASRRRNLGELCAEENQGFRFKYLILARTVHFRWCCS